MKHSLPTLLRSAASKLETQRHRLAAKSVPPDDKLKCGILGAGKFFDYAYVPALNKKNPPLAVTGIWTRNRDNFSSAQKKLRHVARYFSSPEPLLDSGIQAAVVLLPNHLHFSTVKSALERGLHVFCEKPLSNSSAEALALKQIAAGSNRVLMADFNQRFFDRNRVLKNLITGNRIGKISEVHAFHNQDLRGLKSFAALHRDQTGGGVMHNAGIHLVNLFLHWFGEVGRVKAVFENRALPRECGEDTAYCEFWFRNGVHATLTASLANAADTTYERVQFIGREGEISSDLKKCDIRMKVDGKRQLKIPCRTEIMPDSVFNALEHFATCVKNNSRPETDVEDFIRTIKVIEALTLSAARGTEVSLSQTGKQDV